jgi:hypothetical protein
VIERFREFFSNTKNFLHRQVLYISALLRFLREVLFAYEAVENPVGRGYIPSRLIKVLVPDKEEYKILADVLREERAENYATLAWMMRICKAEPAKKLTVHREQGRLTGMKRNHSCNTNQWMTKAVPQAMQAAITESRWMAWISGRSAAKTTEIRFFLTSQSSPQRTDEKNCSVPVALRSGTAEYTSLRIILSDRNCRQGNAQDNAQDNMLGNTKEDKVQGNAREDDAQDIKDGNNSPSSLVAILPLITRSTTRAAEVVSGVSIVHHVLAAKEAQPNDAMDLEVRKNSINKEVRGLPNRRAFSPEQVDAVHSNANIFGTRIVTRLKHFGSIDEESKARSIIQGCQDACYALLRMRPLSISCAECCVLISCGNVDYDKSGWRDD